MSFEELLSWAQEFKPEPAPFTFSGPSILLICLGVFIVLLLVWWLVLIFANHKDSGSVDDDDDDGDSDGDGDDNDIDNDNDNDE